ncbi:TPA: selenocysteine protein [Candidatus Poribacteria bacterium]|nr:selenocysteine protein [Candidatus Poribacteria bacterium]
MKLITESFKQSLMITEFVFVMMILVDYINVLTRGKMNKAVRGGLFRQYIVASFLGSTPGCLGAFMNVSFYVHGLLSFGAIVGGMIATSGDEAFVMLTLFPGKALLLFVILFLMGIALAWVADKIALILKINPCQECQLSVWHMEEGYKYFDREAIWAHFRKLSLARFLLLLLLVIFLYGIASGNIGAPTWDWERITFLVLLSIAVFIVTTAPEHYLEEHIWTHIAKKHLWRIFLWSFFAILFLDLAFKYFSLQAFVQKHMLWVLLIASLVAVIPESGPHLIFVVMFANRLIPFSVLLASSIVQDGHGMLPLVSYTVRDSVLIKLFNLVFGLIIGAILYFIGL